MSTMEQERRVVAGLDARIREYLAERKLTIEALRDSSEECRGLVWAAVRYYEARLAEAETRIQGLEGELAGYRTRDRRQAVVEQAVTEPGRKPVSTRARAWREALASGHTKTLAEKVLQYVRLHPGSTRRQVTQGLSSAAQRYELASVTARVCELLDQGGGILYERGEEVSSRGSPNAKLFVRGWADGPARSGRDGEQ